jgi:hypothetical protein
LPHDRRQRRCRSAPHAAVRVAGPGPRRRAIKRWNRGAGLLALRRERRRPFREDGAQRHRVRPDGRLCRRVQPAARGERWHARRARRRGRGQGCPR